jgi:AraC-like DNA-binding protein
METSLHDRFNMIDCSAATIRFSTAGVPEDIRAASWREHYGLTVFRADIEPADGTLFEAAMVSHALPGLQLVSAKFTAARIIRTREMIVDGNDDFCLFVNQTGDVTVSARGRDVSLQKNDAVLVSSGEAVVFDRRSFGESLAIRIPCGTLSARVVDVDEAIMQRIPGSIAALDLLTCYVKALLVDDHAVATPVLRHRVSSHVQDLAAFALRATVEAAGATRSHGKAAARLRAAKLYTIENIADRDISISRVALHVGVTRRYLQRLFELDGTTFSAYLLRHRLARAHRLLCEPQSTSRQVNTIAYEAGFSDLSYFNRSFRRIYGATPMDIREAASR